MNFISVELFMPTIEQLNQKVFRQTILYQLKKNRKLFGERTILALTRHRYKINHAIRENIKG